jgi:hypothetical protein
MSDMSWRPDLHERLARRDDRRIRALRAATAAAAVSLLGWIVDLASLWHVIAVLGAALGAAAWPSRRGLADAFRTIADQAGLAYQTHLEHVGRDDPHGLLSAAEVQARLSIRGVVPPPQGAWWLPLAAVATALVVLTALVGGPGTWFGGDAGVAVGGPSGPSTPPPVVRDEGAATPEDAATDAAEAAEPTAPGTPAAAPDRGTGPSADDAGDGDGGGALEREELDRFLEALRERPSVRDSVDPRSGVERDGVRDDADADLRGAQLREDGADMGDDPRRTPDQRSEEAGEADRSVEVPAGAGMGDDDGDEAGEPEDGEGAEAGTSDVPGVDEGEDGSAADGEQPGEAPTGAAEGAPDDAPEVGGGADDPSLDAGTGDEGGIGPGAAAGVDGQIPEPAGDLEALPGILGSGPETVGGRVRLPGRDSDVAPTAVSAEGFERAIEQAVTDGSVPVPYQEIIRNYFR